MLPWPLYLQINDWFMEEGTAEGVFGAMFSKLTVNLACRGDNTKQVCLKHLMYSGDSFAIPFSHEKCNQRGDDLTKRLARHCYANPLDASADFVSSVFHYLVLHPDLIAQPNSSILVGSQDAQCTNFNRILKKVLREHRDEHGLEVCESKFGMPLKECSMYSWRKCAHTMINCGSTVGPTSAAVCLWEGKSLGASHDPYIAQEVASDRVTGRILTCLPINLPEFAASYPDFIPIDVEQSLMSSVSEAEYNEHATEVNSMMEEVIDSIFGAENMAVFPGIHPLLRIGLASHLHHYNEINNLIPPNGKLHQTPLKQ